MALVSIVLPVYNGEKYLRESMDSILAQTWQEWELICVDDCSTDSTPEILREYAARDSRIRVIRNERNQKLPRSLNIGFAEAKGEFLTWTSDDNAYLPEALRVMHETLMKHEEVPMVVGDMELMDSQGNFYGIRETYEKEKMYLNNCVGACFMYRHTVMEQIGEYDTSCFLVEDYDYWMRIQKFCGAILHIPRKLYRYRIHQESLSSTRMHDVYLQRMKLLENYFSEIMQIFPDGKECIFQLYLDGIIHGIDMNIYKEKFLKYLPEMKSIALSINDKGFPKDGFLVLFGAGELGKIAIHRFGHRVIGFVDNDKNKWGTAIEDVPVFSIDEFIEKNF